MRLHRDDRRESAGGVLNSRALGEAALFFGNGGEALEFFGVDDGEIEAGFGAVIEEDGVDHFARGGGQAEGDVGDAENGFDVRECSP